MRCLFVFRHSPWDGSRGAESLDLLLTLAAFDQELEVLLLDDGVWHLHPGQSPGVLGLRDLSALWRNLPLYGIGASPWVEDESLRARGLQDGDLSIPVRRIQRGRLAEFWNRFDTILGD